MQRMIDRTDHLTARAHETKGRQQLRRADRRTGVRPTILLSPRALTLPGSYPGKRFWNTLKESVESYDLLRSKGHNIRILRSSSEGKGAQEFIKFMFTEELERKRPGSTLSLDIHDEQSDAIMWPRDRFQIYGDLIFSQPESKYDTRKILNALGFPPSVVIEKSVLGEGGLVVRAGKTLIVSEAARNRGIRRGEIECLEHRGYEIHFLPAMSDTDILCLNRRKDPEDHIDTEFGLALTRGGNALACVNPYYYSVFRKQVDRVVKRIGALLYVAPEGTMAINFISLPKGKVIISDHCASTTHFLERNLGASNVTAIKVNPAIYSKGGGLRCMSNVIE